MDVESTCALPVASLLWQPRPERWSLTVVCRATYALEPGVSPLASKQLAPLVNDQYPDDDRSRGLYAPTDLVPLKLRADIVLVGHAYAPEGQPVSCLEVRLAIGPLDKKIAVMGDRSRRRDGQISQGPPFVWMALGYDRAARGSGDANPVGMRVDVPNGSAAVALPNLQPAAADLTAGEAGEPVGFGPIAPDWPVRRYKLGTLADRWSEEHWYRTVLPEDFDFAFFNVAPLDQQVSLGPPPQSLTLENLHPDHPRLTTDLVPLRPTAFVQRAQRSTERIELLWDTLWIDTRQAICSLTWRAQLSLAEQLEAGRVIVTTAEKGPPSMPVSTPIRGGTDNTTVPADEPSSVPAQPSTPQLPPTPAPVPASGPPAPKGSSPWAAAQTREASTAPSVKRTTPASTAVKPPNPLAASAATGSANHFERDGAVDSAQGNETSVERDDVIQLIWFDPKALEWIRRQPEWRPLLEQLQEKTVDAGAEEVSLGASAMEAEDRREMYELLSQAPAADLGAIGTALREGCLADGRYAAQLLLLTGELFFPFDEVETLRATVATVAPLASSDEMQSVLEVAKEFLQIPNLTSPAGVAEGITSRLIEAFSEAKRSVSADYVQTHTDQVLLERRHYQRRAVLGDAYLRALLKRPDRSRQIPVYLPAKLADSLPMFQCFTARFITAVRLAQDQNEQYPACLEVLALSRVVSLASLDNG